MFLCTIPANDEYYPDYIKSRLHQGNIMLSKVKKNKILLQNGYISSIMDYMPRRLT